MIDSRISTIYYLRTVEKKSYPELAKMYKRSRRTMYRCVALFRKTARYMEQTADDIVAFYESEIAQLRERRKGKTDRIYIEYTSLIIKLESKIAEVLKLTDSKIMVDQSQHTHHTIIWEIDGKQSYKDTVTPQSRIGLAGQV